MNSYLPVLVAGLSTGSIYALAAMGLTLTYKTSGVFNFGQGAIAAAAAYLFYELHITHHMAWPLAFAITLVGFGMVVGLAMEAIARTLSSAPASQRIVATVGVLLVFLSGCTVIFGVQPKVLPEYLGRHVHKVGAAYFTTSDVVKAAIALGAALGLAAFFRRTRIGAAMRAVVDDPDLLDLTGVSPVRVRRTSWIIGSSFAATSGMLVAPLLNVDATLLTLLVVRAFGACAIGRFTSLPLTYAGGLIVGVGEQLVQKYTASHASFASLYPDTSFLVLIFVMLFMPKGKLVEVGARIRMRAAARPAGRSRVRIGVALAGLTAMSLGPFIIDGTRLSTANAALAQVVLYLSLALLVRVSGQVSLCHVALQGAGAAFFGHAVSHGGLAGFNLGLPWGLGVVVAGLLTVPLGLLVAIPAIRLSGTFLALATLGFGILLQTTAFNWGLFFGDHGAVLTPRPSGATGPWAFYYVGLGVVILCAAAVLVIERSRLGRLLRAMSDSTTGLTTLGASVDVARTLAFAISAFLAGVSGALLGGVGRQSNALAFQALASLALVAILAISGVLSGGGTIATAVVAGVVFTYLPSYSTDSSVTAANAFQLGFGAVAIAAAVFGQGRGTEVVRRITCLGHTRDRSPLTARSRPVLTTGDKELEGATA